MNSLTSPSSSGKLERVEQIAVLRPNGIGDFIFTLPALSALRAAYPHAHIVLIGKRWHCAFLPGRTTLIDEVAEMPEVRGVGAPPDAQESEQDVEHFIDGMHRRRFDLAVQVFGGGRYSNAFIKRLMARTTIGLRTPEAESLDRWVPYHTYRNERLRMLEVVALAGAPAAALSPRLAVLPADLSELAQTGIPAAPLVVLHPGAGDTRRRWAPRFFAAVGDALTARGAQVVVNGSADERDVAQAVVQAMRTPALNLAGRLSLGASAALLAQASLLVGNDSGPLHVAEALGTPSVGIFWVLNLLNAEPLVAGPHRFAISTRTRCPVCDAENVHERCVHGASFVDDVRVEEVTQMALDLFSRRHERLPVARESLAAR